MFPIELPVEGMDGNVGIASLQGKPIELERGMFTFFFISYEVQTNW